MCACVVVLAKSVVLVVCVGRVARPYLLREDAQRSAGKLSQIPQHVVVAGLYV